MKKWLFLPMIMLMTGLVFAESNRIQQISNEKVNVWERALLPNQILPMHRHDHDRIIIALTDGILKIVNNDGTSHLMLLKKDHAYYYPKDQVGEVHNDKNVSGKTVKVMVVELL